MERMNKTGFLVLIVTLLLTGCSSGITKEQAIQSAISFVESRVVTYTTQGDSMVNVTKPEIAVKEIIEKEKSWEVILALQSTTNNSMKKRGLIVVVDKKSGSVLGNPTSFPI